MTSSGRAPSGQALVASDQAASRLAPSGFDPSRWDELADWCEQAVDASTLALLDEHLTAMVHPFDKDMQRLAAKGSFRPTRSLDAAMHLVPFGHWFLIGKDTNLPWARVYDVERLYGCPEGYGGLREAISPALALCAAACRAHATIAMEARRAETEGLDAKHDSAVAKPIAQSTLRGK